VEFEKDVKDGNKTCKGLVCIVWNLKKMLKMGIRPARV